jgi:hypothetical protein
MPEGLRRRLQPAPGLICETRTLLEACVTERGRRLVKRPVPDRLVVASVNAERVGHV